MSNADVLEDVLNTTEHTVEFLEIDDPRVVEATVESFTDHTTITICIPASQVDQEYNPGDDPNRDREPESYHELFGVDDTHNELVEMLCEAKGMTKVGAGKWLADNMKLTDEIDGVLFFTAIIRQ